MKALTMLALESPCLGVRIRPIGCNEVRVRDYD